jgi:hypothetical protein
MRPIKYQIGRRGSWQKFVDLCNRGDGTVFDLVISGSACSGPDSAMAGQLERVIAASIHCPRLSMDLRWISGLRRIELLSITGARPSAVPDWGVFPHLREVEVDSVTAGTGLGCAPSLEQASLRGSAPDVLESLAGAPTLASLELLDWTARDAGAVADMRFLRTLVVRRMRRSAGTAFPRLPPGLTTLAIVDGLVLPDLNDPSHWTGVQTLRIQCRREVDTIAGLRGAQRLEDLWLDGLCVADGRVRWLRTLPKVREVLVSVWPHYDCADEAAGGLARRPDGTMESPVDYFPLV